MMDSIPSRSSVPAADAPAVDPAVVRTSVLLVDDDPVIRRSYGDHLRAEGFALTVAADGYDVLQMTEGHHFDVLLLDLRMPHRNGADVLRALRLKPGFDKTAVFLLAQPGDADLVDRAIREGAALVLEKARLTPRDVVHEIRTFLDAAAGGPTDAAPHAATPASSPPSADERSYTTVLHRFVGESARLAAALGLSEDYLCPACRQLLALRLWPDRSSEAAVRGHFFCPTCTS